MYKKVLYNMKKSKKNVGGGEIFERKTLFMYLKKENKKVKKRKKM